MIGVLTGDIINSESCEPQKWISLLSDYFNTIGKTPVFWEIYRGDEFQLKITEVEQTLITALHIKVLLKTMNDLDVRMGIGIGDERFKSEKITQSNGTAYVNSGRIFDQTKLDDVNLLIKSNCTIFDSTINMMLQLALTFMDDWSVVSANMLKYVLENPGKSQNEMAKALNVSQSTISQRLTRANYHLILKLNTYFSENTQKLK